MLNKRNFKKNDEDFHVYTAIASPLIKTDIICGLLEGKIKIVDMKTGKIKLALDGHSERVYKLLILPNSNLLSCSSDGTIKVWDLESFTLKRNILPKIGRISTMDLLDEAGTKLAIGTLCGRFTVIDFKTEKTIFSNFNAHQNRISSLVNIRNNRFATASYDKTIKVWMTNNGKMKKVFNDECKVDKILLLTNGNLASSSFKSTIKIWDLDKYELVQTLNGYELCELENSNLASGTADMTIKVWDVNTGECKQTFSGHKNPIVSLIYLLNKYLVSISKGREIKIWKL